MIIRIEWARAYRGRLWHLTKPERPLSTYCDDADLTLVEHLDNLPPRGGRVCPRCADAIYDIHVLVQAALAQESFVTGEPAAPNEYGVPSPDVAQAMRSDHP